MASGSIGESEDPWRGAVSAAEPREEEQVRRVQCAWCRRLKGPDGEPVGPALPVQSFGTHGICTECARQRLSIPREALVSRDAVVARSAPRRRYSPPGLGVRRVVAHRPRRGSLPASGGPVVRASCQGERCARVVVGPGLLELQTDDGRTLRSVIFERSSPESRCKAHEMLAGEARALGYVLVGETDEILAAS